MPILKMDDFGQVYECDAALDGEHGVGRVADYVADDDMLKLSDAPTKQELLDRAKVRAKELAKKRFDELQAKKNEVLMRAQEYIIAQKQRLAGAQMIAAQKQAQHKKDMIRLRGLAQQAQNFEPVGVSGDGRSATGLSPNTYSDWAPAIECAEDFGMMYDEARADFGAVASTMTKEEMSKLTIDQQHIPNNIGPMTEDDDFIMRQWVSNTYAVGVKSSWDGGQTYHPQNLVFDLNIKNNIEAYPSVSLDEKNLSSARGWQWTAYFENGMKNVVRVPRVFGLPITDMNGVGASDWEYWGPNFEGDSRLGAILAPVIKAYAKKFDVGALKVRAELERFEQERIAREQELLKAVQFEADQQTQAAKADVVSQIYMPSFWERLKMAFGSGYYQHPMLKHNLIKRK